MSQLLIKGKFEKLKKLVILGIAWENTIRSGQSLFSRDELSSNWKLFYQSIIHLADAKVNRLAFNSLSEISIPEVEEWSVCSHLRYIDLRDELYERGIKLDKNSDGKPTAWPWGALDFPRNSCPYGTEVDFSAKDSDGRFKAVAMTRYQETPSYPPNWTVSIHVGGGYTVSF